MLGDIRQAQKVYIVCGYTDMRKGLNSLVLFVQQNFGIDPYSSSLFLFCGKRCDRLKALLWELDGFVLLYKNDTHAYLPHPLHLRSGQHPGPSKQALRLLSLFDGRQNV